MAEEFSNRFVHMILLFVRPSLGIDDLIHSTSPNELLNRTCQVPTDRYKL